MESKVILYQRCEIEKEKLFIVDSLSTYLLSLTKKTITDFQYVRQGRKISIKVDMTQASINPDDVDNYNYLSIQNGSEHIFYYFIDNKEQVSPNTIRFYLSLDSINTFRLGTDFFITDKTMLNRMHKNRYAVLESDLGGQAVVVTGSGKTVAISPIRAEYTYYMPNTDYTGYSIDAIDITINDNNVSLVSYTINAGTIELTFRSTLPHEFSFYASIDLIGADRVVRKIDKMSEGVSPILYGRDLGKLIEENFKENAYLVYKGSSAINCMLTFDDTHEVKIGAKDALDPSDFTANTYYYFMVDYDGTPNATFYKVVGGDEYPIHWLDKSGWYRDCVVLWTDGTNIYLGYIIIYDNRSYGARYVARSMEPVNVGTQIKVESNAPSLRAFTGASWTTNEETIYGLPQTSLALTTATKEIRPISSLDRSSSELVKIIKLPYSIVALDNVDTSWGYNATDHMLQYINLDKKLLNSIKIPYSDVNNPLAELNFPLTPAKTDLKSPDYESKLWHSDYYQPKFVYDSFSKVFALERIDLSSYELFGNADFVFDFMASNTITSKFLFGFPQYITEGYMQEDFDNILPVDRNNEMTIYSSEYLQYIKTGFNYDIKKKNREIAFGGATTALAIVGSVATFAVSPKLAIAGIALASTAMTKIISTINSAVQAEATQQQKLAQLRQQKDSVYNTDAVDLLDYYCDNKAKLMLYEVGENVKKSLFDLFFYTGYICAYRGTPDFTSRTRFNFVSCDLDFDMGKTGSKYLSEEILQDISAKFSAGVTNIHYYDNTWDFEQKFENWETMFFS